MGIKYKNNAITIITADIDDKVTTIPVSNAAVFPELGENDYCYLTIGEGNINMEIVKVTAIVGNNLTVVREQQGTVGKSFLSGAPIELRLTAGMLQAGFDEVADFASSEASSKVADGVKINTLTEKTTLVDNDLVGGENSANSFSRISILMSSVWNYIKGKMITLKILPKEMLEANTTFTVGGNRATAVSIVNAGTGYTADDILICQGGTGSPTYIKVLTVDVGGEILTAEVNRKGCYTANPTNPVSVTGGTGSDATFNLTIEEVERDYDDLATACYDVYNKYYPKAVAGGLEITVNCLSGYVMNKPLVIAGGIYMGFITITSVDAEVVINRSSLTTIVGGAYPAFSASGNSVLPTIGALFNMDTTGDSTNRDGITVSYNSQVIVYPDCGVKNAGRVGAYAIFGSTISASNAIFTGAASIGVDNLGGHIILDRAQCRKGEVNDPTDIRVQRGGIISIRTGAPQSGGVSQTVNTITGNGIIFSH